jgi:hypothetical protein
VAKKHQGLAQLLARLELGLLVVISYSSLAPEDCHLRFKQQNLLQRKDLKALLNAQ